MRPGTENRTGGLPRPYISGPLPHRSPFVMCIIPEPTNPRSRLPRSSPSDMAAPTSLYKFTTLPPELRNSIWESALPPPRVFDICPASNSQKTPAQQGLCFANPYSEPPPPLAAVCRESRSLSLYHYRALTLGGTTKYVNLARDVLLLESYLFERDLLRTLLFMSKIPLIRDNLRSLAFGTSYGVHTGLWHPVLGWKKLTRSNMGRLLQRLGTFEKLERLVFVINQEVQYEVAELPCEGDMMQGNYLWSGQVSRNATLYERGTTPPGPRLLAGYAEYDEEVSSRASTPSVSSESSCSSDSDASSCSFYRMPWTEQKPWPSYENEVSYFPCSPVEDDEPPATGKSAHLRGPGPTSDDWRRFRRTFKRDLEVGLASGLASPRTKTGSCPKRKRDSEDVRQDDHEPRRPKCIRRSGEGIEGYRLPEIQGANLLWRYSLPS